MSSVNKVIILGRLTKDPEIRFMPNGEGVANFSLATSESWKTKEGEKKEKAEFHNCVAYRKLSEVIGQYLRKGSQVYIEGKLTTEKYEKDGVTKYSTKIIVNEMTMLGGKPSGESSESDKDNPGDKPAARPDKNFENFDDDIHF